MPEEGKEEKGRKEGERRSGKDRRKGDLDDLFRRLISSGAFEERRKKSDRRKTPSLQDQLNIRIYLN